MTVSLSNPLAPLKPGVLAASMLDLGMRMFAETENSVVQRGPHIAF